MMMARWYCHRAWEGGPPVYMPEEMFPPEIFAKAMAEEPHCIFEAEGDPMVGPCVEMWTVYDHPADYPDHFCARRSKSGREGVVQTRDVVVGQTLAEVRGILIDTKGMSARMERNSEDDPTIMEVWI